MTRWKQCHRGLQGRGRVLGVDPALGFGATATFALACELGTSPVLAVCGAAASAWGIEALRRGRLPGFAGAIRDFLRWPAFHSALGSDDVPSFPSDLVGRCSDGQ